MKKIIFVLFCALLFLTPIILWPFTSEVFEFNKMVFVYVTTTLIVTAWLTRSVLVKKFIFRRTILDIPLLVFIASQLISTIFSMDPRTSVFGYYSRFNGGMLSVICYALLYWAFVSNLDRKSTLLALRSTLFAAVLVSIYGVLEHFGIDKGIWVQDVQSRVFSTLGQPNWLAAFIVALTPLVWSNTIFNFKFPIFNYLLSALFFIVLLFTGSRSGLLGFAIAFLIFWTLSFWKYKRSVLKQFIIISSSFLVISLALGTEVTPSLSSLITHSTIQPYGPEATQGRGPINQSQGTSLETGGTESGTIRQIVWKGALQVWLHYPIFGTGVETFAYSYYLYRPAEHNMTSEWDFIYNKAHNEFLNVAANSGTFGLLAYLILIGFSIYQISNPKHEFRNSKQIQNSNFENLKLFRISDFDIRILNVALLAGYVSLLVTNFFGFSVVPTELEFFLFPAIAVALAEQSTERIEHREKMSSTQKIIIAFVLCSMFYALFAVGKYWYSDYLYAKGRGYNQIKRPDIAINYLEKAINFVPKEPLYHEELATSYVGLALAFNQEKETENASQFANAATSEIENAQSLSSANVILKRTEYGVFANLAAINSGYLIDARDTLIAAVALAPTDAKLHYYLGLTYTRIGQTDLGLQTLKETIALKPDYQEAKDAYAIILKASSTSK